MGGSGGRRRFVVVLFFTASTAFTASTVAAQGIDPTGRWRTFQSPHFNIHVRADYLALGPRVAAEAEAAWAELSRVLPPPSRRVELVVADNTDEPNGYA